MNFGGIPVLGLDTSGNPLNLIPTKSGTTLTGGHVNNLGTGMYAWSLTQVTSIARNPAGDLVCLGYGSTKDGTTENLTWVRKSNNWMIGPSGIDSVGSLSIAYDGSKYVAAVSNIKTSSFALVNSSPASGFAGGPPVYDTTIAASANSVTSNGSKAIAYAIGTVGTWIGPTFTHVLGIPVEVVTGHYATTYTFPGASGSNLQVQSLGLSAIPPADTVPSDWGNTSETAEGYYGLINNPHFTISWPATTIPG